ncbi:MAG TPA: nucleotidyltransferase family protein [Pyrinomonadaceae bacterium]|nr:nucleotidyltransferase family protein [Pyrinomonadaceae bacterium]
MPDVAAVLLAAGRSKRMGVFKPLLPFGKQTVIESCIDYLRKGGVETIVVVLGHRAGEVRARINNLGVVCVVNPDPDSQMNASIAAGVRELPDSAKATLIALADHPAVPPTVVSKLISTWQQGGGLLIPTWQNRGGHPVLIDLRYRKELENLDPNRGLKGLFESHPGDLKRVPVDSPFIARDMDTWDDYHALYKEVFGEPPPEPPER